MKCCDYNAGMLREPVAFLRRTRTSDGSGGSTDTWATVSGSATMAYAKAVSGSERYASDRVEASVRLRIAVRYFPGLMEDDCVVVRGRRCNIRFVNNVEFRDRWIEIDVDGGVAL